jgi:hypothetical protein
MSDDIVVAHKDKDEAENAADDMACLFVHQSTLCRNDVMFDCAKLAEAAASVTSRWLGAVIEKRVDLPIAFCLEVDRAVLLPPASSSLVTGDGIPVPAAELLKQMECHELDHSVIVAPDPLQPPSPQTESSSSDADSSYESAESSPEEANVEIEIDSVSSVVPHTRLFIVVDSNASAPLLPNSAVLDDAVADGIEIVYLAPSTVQMSKMCADAFAEDPGYDINVVANPRLLGNRFVIDLKKILDSYAALHPAALIIVCKDDDYLFSYDQYVRQAEEF